MIAHYCQHCLLPIEVRDPTCLAPWLLCQSCLAMLSIQARCDCCGMTTLQPVTQCGRCLSHPPPWQRLYCVGDYTPPLSDYVQQLKFSRQLHYVELLAELLALRIDPNTQMITFVPLHWRRQLWRGFNQSELLAQALAQRLSLPCESLFKRTRVTDAQRGMDRKQRQRNLRGAFQLTQSVQGVESVAIVDDVVTTGSTVQQLCKLLLDAGVKSVDIYCICRTPE
ncbi:putative amidophosphoribosyltransferase [Vibrio ichthyoenteri ATCC 700023]|uniref:Putative amidophosphoribosyltransferase n=2 Tax=Vibrio ichthyoenteri TaxID=142461 RepID=F9S4I3_9VIBR|nr:putative amidophosphoribosyltransferase [Vibrio ichthyoenteri ATCC 700023]